MLSTARARTGRRVEGRHVLAIQDTSALRVDEKGIGLSFHPVIAVDGVDGTMLGLVDNFNKEEILDLIAYLRSAGDPKDKAFQK